MKFKISKFAIFIIHIYFFLIKVEAEPQYFLPNEVFTPESSIQKAIFAPVYFPCNECYKIINEYVNTCLNAEIKGVQIKTFLAFCESLALEQDPKYNSSTYQYCLNIHKNILGETHQENPDYTPYESDVSEHFFLKYKQICDKFEELPKISECYSGFCDKYVNCIDCPSGLNQIDSEFHYEFQVCSGHGICKLGWLNEKNEEKRLGGNGYCECYEGRKGLACDQIVGKGFRKLPEKNIKISKKTEFS